MNEHPPSTPPEHPNTEPVPDDGTAGHQVLLVTGMSGAGKSQALKALEDMGYEAVDNVPLSLLGSLIATAPALAPDGTSHKPIAIGVDIRTRDFGIESFLSHLEQLLATGTVDARVLFMDCDDDELRRRYSETRHRHPLAQDRPVSDGISHERRLLRALRDRADIVLDTTGMGPGDLKRRLQGHLPARPEQGLTLFVTSFAYPKGLPREADLVFDVRFLNNPHYDPALKALSGRDKAVADYIAADPGFQQFFDGLTGMLHPLLPRYADEGKSYLTLAIGCTGGRHRSVFIAECLTGWLQQQGQSVHLSHRDVNRTSG